MKVEKGLMLEWLMRADCKSAGYAYVGSNPTQPNSCLSTITVRI